MDILIILETAAAEIRTLREQAAAQKLMLKNQTIRIAISQLRRNKCDCADCDGDTWEKIRAGVESGLIRMDHTGTVLHGNSILGAHHLTA